MWTKWILVFGLTFSVCARISGLQNDYITGYSYRQPDDVSLTTVPASLAYYINIPAGQSLGDYYYLLSKPENQYNHYPSQYHTEGLARDTYRQQQYAYNQDQGYYSRQQQPDTIRANNYRGYTSNEVQQHSYTSQSLPYANSAGDFAPRGATEYQVEPRSRSHYHQAPPPESPYKSQQGRSIPPHAVTYRDYQDYSAPSQELSPPPPYDSRETSQYEYKGFGGSAGKQQQYRAVPPTASLPTSYNAQLPFAIGTVPIKFKPFPLKTHLRQTGLLPITSYQAREFYKK